MAEKIRLVLADDHAIQRAGLASLLTLEPDLDVVAEASTGGEAVERVRTLKPDVVIMDIDMPGIGGLEATRQMTVLEQEKRVLVLTSHAETDTCCPCWRRGERVRAEDARRA
jgi:DNA-binding NarL/FixJ family response regulator